MSDLKHSNNDITTDAVPNPRGTQNKEDDAGCDNAINNNSAENNEKSRKNDPLTFNTRKKSSSKKFSPTSASATVINISSSTDIHVGNKFTYIYNGNEKERENKKTDILETSAIKSLKESKTTVTKEDLLFLSQHIDTEWKNVARSLGLSEGQISQFITDNQVYGTKEVIYQILLDWYQNNPIEATVGKLCNILWTNNQKDVVNRWSQEKN